MNETDKMKCPECGALMNHHADKLYENAAPAGASEESEVVIEAHTCPDCGCSATRQASPGSEQ
jgi:ribosomal protein S27AE